MSTRNYVLGNPPAGTDWRSTQLCPRCDGYGTREIAQACPVAGGTAVHTRECGACQGLGNIAYAQPTNTHWREGPKAARDRAYAKGVRERLKKGEATSD